MNTIDQSPLLPADRNLMAVALSGADPAKRAAAAKGLLCRLSFARWWDVAGGYPQEPSPYKDCSPVVRKEIFRLAERLADVLGCKRVQSVTGGGGDLWLLSLFSQTGICSSDGNAGFLRDMRNGRVKINSIPLHIGPECADVYGLEGTISYDFALIERGKKRFFAYPER